MKIKATKTDKYFEAPHLPIVTLVEGQEYDLSDKLGARVVELKGGVEVKEKTEKKVVDPDSKDEGAPEVKKKGGKK